AGLKSAASHTAHVGEFVSPEGSVVDQVVAVVFRKPSSYTGEDVVEISCHGGLLVTQKVLQALLDYGAAQAAPGEFTKRAFLNGKIDLSQAEAVADLIRARSDRALRNSLDQLKGELAGRVSELREGLIRTTGILELELDFAEEGFEFADKTGVGRQIVESIGSIRSLLETYRMGRLYRDGVKVVLAGMPNVGKSSILNALLKENRAIVTDIPGTTRDTIEESLTINGLMFRVVDTAGLREAVDRVEQEGVRRSRDQIKTSDLLVLIHDGSKPAEKEEIALAARLIRDLKGQAPAVMVLNKIDLGSDLNGSLGKEVGRLAPDALVETSAATGEGIELLKETLYKTALAGGSALQESGITVTNARHYDALKRTAASLELALESIRSGASGEFVTIDLRAALNTLGEITGAVTTDDILNEIFSKFCIGK
ncbi:MAG TPA: tRNA uridine-5-carboxymethylaminomethyl(34) synthesis GTPase MnmE, partial [Bacteroidota bacterium]